MTIKEFKRKIKYKGFNELLEAYVFICDKYHYSDRQTALELIVDRLKRFKEWSLIIGAYYEFTYNQLDYLK